MHCRGAHGGVCFAGFTMKRQPNDVEGGFSPGVSCSVNGVGGQDMPLVARHMGQEE